MVDHQKLFRVDGFQILSKAVVDAGEIDKVRRECPLQLMNPQDRKI